MVSLRFLRFGIGLVAGLLYGGSGFTSISCVVPSTASFGDQISITAMVSGMGSGTPTGSIVIYDGSTIVGMQTLGDNGIAKVAVTFGLGPHSVSCGYLGDASFNPSTSATTMLTVVPAAPKIILSPSQNPISSGQPVVIDIRVVAMGGSPSGSVTLLDGTTVLVVLPLFQEQDDSVAQFTASSLAPGTHSITATYDGDAMFAASTTAQPLLLVVGKPSTTTSILSATASPNSQITIRVQVSSALGIPTGTVTLTEGAGGKAGSTTFGSGSLSGGVATIVFTGLTTGAHSIVANYSGDANFAASVSAPVTVTGTATLTNILLAGSPNPAQVGQAVTLTATVTSPAGTAAGTVTFQGSQGALGSAELNSAGQATLTATFAATGTQAITAAFAGNGQFAASTSAPLILTVIPRQLAIVSSASGSPTVSPDSLVSIFGDKLAAQVVSAALLPWPMTLGGASVVFRDGTGVERLAALKFVSPGQINAVVPPDAPLGQETVIVRNGTVDVMSGVAVLANVSPALYSGDGSGKGGAAGLVLVVHANDGVDFKPTFFCDNAGNCGPALIDLGTGNDQAFLTLFGTGIRRGGSAARVLIGGQILTPSYAGPQPQYGGVDQVNVTLPASFRGAGVVSVAVAIGDQVSNTVTVRFQ